MWSYAAHHAAVKSEFVWCPLALFVSKTCLRVVASILRSGGIRFKSLSNLQSANIEASLGILFPPLDFLGLNTFCSDYESTIRDDISAKVDLRICGHALWIHSQKKRKRRSVNEAWFGWPGWFQEFVPQGPRVVPFFRPSWQPFVLPAHYSPKKRLHAGARRLAQEA